MPDPKLRNLTITHEPSLVERYFSYGVLAIGIIAVLPILFQPHDEVMHLHEFGGIPCWTVADSSPLTAMLVMRSFPRPIVIPFPRKMTESLRRLRG